MATAARRTVRAILIDACTRPAGTARPVIAVCSYREAWTPAEPLQHHEHTLTCRHAGEFQIVAGENVPRVLDLQLLATSEEIPFW